MIAIQSVRIFVSLMEIFHKVESWFDSMIGLHGHA